MLFRTVCLLLILASSALAQNSAEPALARPQTYTPPEKTKPVLPEGLADVVAKQFGPEFELAADTPAPFLHADFDGDQVPDAAIVVRSKSPMAGVGEFGYTVQDPHHAYFGFGDPKVTAQFSLQDHRSLILLVIHGAGEQAWRAPQPKAKFVLINVPFDRVHLASFKHKKKTRVAISAVESSVMSSMVFFDGKRYRWEPNAAD